MAFKVANYVIEKLLGVQFFLDHYEQTNLDRTITFNSVTLKNTQTEPQIYIFFSTKQIIFRVEG